MSDTLENGLYHPEFRSNLKSIGRGRASPNRQRGFRTGSPNDVVAHAAAHGLGHVWPWLVFLGACVAALMIYVEWRWQRGRDLPGFCAMAPPKGTASYWRAGKWTPHLHLTALAELAGVHMS